MSLYKVGKTKWMSERSNSPKVTPLPLGRLRVERRFDLHSKTYTEHDEFNTDKPEDLTIRAFAGYGLLDGINLEELPANPTGDEWSAHSKHRAYKDCRLIDEVSDPGQDAKWIVTQIYETLTDTWEREDIDRKGSTGNGLDTLTRSQVARRNAPFNFDKDDVGRSVTLNFDGGTADFTVGQTLTGAGNGATGEIVEVFGTTEKGTLTLRTLTGTLADGESISDGAGGSAAVDGDTLYLAAIDPQSSDRMGKYVTRWAEAGVLNYTNKLRYGSLLNEHIITTVGDLSLADAKAAVGISAVTTASLDVEIGEYEGFRTRVYRLYNGEGVISTSTTTRYNGVLTKTTIVALNEEPTKPSVNAVLVDARVEDRGEGQTIYTYTYVDGQGVYSTKERTKHNGALTLTTLKSINEVPTYAGALVDTGVDEGDGYTVYTYTFASGQGEVSRSTTSKYNSVLSFETVVAINEIPTGPGAAFKTEVDEGDGYLIYTYTFVSGSGEIDRSVKTKYNGALTITTVSSIDAVPSEPGALIDAKTDQRDGYVIYTHTYASGSGEINRSTSTRHNGKLTLTTVTSLDVAPSGEAGALLDSKVDQGDGYIIYTHTYASGSGVIDTDTKLRHNGALTLTTIRAINEAPSGPGVRISHSVSESNGYTLYTDTYADGSGEIDRSVKTRHNNKLTLETVRSINTTPTGTGAIIDQSTTEADGYTIYTYTFADGSGVIDTTTKTRHNGALILTTVRSINDTPTGTGVQISTSTTEADGYTIYTATYADGSGEIDRSTKTRHNGKLTLTTVRSINDTPTGTGAIIDQSTTEADGYTIYTATYADGSGEIDRSTSTKHNGALILTTVTSLGTPVTGPGALIRSETSQADGYTIYTRTTADGSGEIDRSTKTKHGGALVITTVRSIDTKITGPGVEFDSSTSQADGYTIYTTTSASGSGEIRRSDDSRSDGSVITTVTSINTKPIGPGDAYEISNQEEERDGHELFTKKFYKMPNDYTVPVTQLIQKPAEIIIDSSKGPHIAPGNPGIWVTATGQAEVEFTTSPSVETLSTDLKPVAIAQESVTFEDGQKLYRNTIFRNSWGNYFLNLSNSTYMGKPTSSGAVTVSGGQDPSGSQLVGWKADPYFVSGGVTVFKVTKTMITI